MMDAYTNAFNIAGQLADRESSRLMDMATPKDLKKTYCIGNELKMMNLSSIQAMLLGVINNWIQTQIQNILDYVCAEEQAVASNVLAKFCIPIPSYGLPNLSLQATGLEACNGTPLLSLQAASNTTIVPLSSATAVVNYFNTLRDK
jgi:hypothetical protein